MTADNKEDRWLNMVDSLLHPRVSTWYVKRKKEEDRERKERKNEQERMLTFVVV